MKSRIAKLIVVASLSSLGALADEPAVVEIELPAGLTLQKTTAPTAELEPAHRIPYQEQRVGGRLERVTVTRENGITEVYQNNRADTVWGAQENEIGEVPNMRQWVIGTW